MMILTLFLFCNSLCCEGGLDIKLLYPMPSVSFFGSLFI